MRGAVIVCIGEIQMLNCWCAMLRVVCLGGVVHATCMVEQLLLQLSGLHVGLGEAPR